jgi:hypothetical protein
MLELLVTLVVGLVVIALLWYILTVLPLPEPFGRVAQVVVIVLAFLWLIYVLMGMLPGGTVRLR